MKMKSILMVPAILIGMAMPASASLVGTEFSYQSFINDNNLVDTQLNFSGGFIKVGTSLPFVENFQVIVGPSQLTLKYTSFGDFGTTLVDPYSVRFFNLDWGSEPGSITGASISGNTTAFGDPTINNILADEFTLDLTSIENWTFNQDITVSLDVDHAPIPLPGALPLFLSALAGIGYMARRKQKAA